MPKGIYNRTEEHRKITSLTHKGKAVSLETRKKLSLSRIGKIPWNRGIKRPEMTGEKNPSKRRDVQDKISKALKGKSFSDEHRKNISLSKKGKEVSILSRENLRRMSESNKGKKLSREHKIKISESHKGEKSYLWKGGITPINQKIRQSLDMKFFIKNCLKRDNFTDKKTGQIGGKLEVHHINNFADFPELRFDVTNGITLSKESHNEFHKIYGKKNNTREQLEEFLINK